MRTGGARRSGVFPGTQARWSNPSSSFFTLTQAAFGSLVPPQRYAVLRSCLLLVRQRRTCRLLEAVTKGHLNHHAGSTLTTSKFSFPSPTATHSFFITVLTSITVRISAKSSRGLPEEYREQWRISLHRCSPLLPPRFLCHAISAPMTDQ